MHTKEDIEAMNLDISLGVNGIRETSQLRDSAEVRNEVLADLPGTSSFADVFEFLVADQTTDTSVREDHLRQLCRRLPFSRTDGMSVSRRPGSQSFSLPPPLSSRRPFSTDEPRVSSSA